MLGHIEVAANSVKLRHVDCETGEPWLPPLSRALALGVRVLGDRRTGWGLGILGRYRTEGLTTLEGEIEAGLIGSCAQRRLHLDLGLVAGKGIEEEEADGEAVVRLGYDALDFMRVGLEGRVRRELGEEEERAAQAGDEWDAFGGPQATFAFNHFFASLTLGPQKVRASQDVGVLAHFVLGGVAF